MKNYSLSNNSVKKLLDKKKFNWYKPEEFKKSIDLGKYCLKVEKQSFNDCAANAGTSFLEFYHNFVFKQKINFSRMFLYKVARELFGWKGDSGVYIRNIIGVLKMIGSIPEKFWKYKEKNVDKEISPLIYSLAANYKINFSFRLDEKNISSEELIDRIKLFLNNQYVILTGFWGFGGDHDTLENKDGSYFPPHISNEIATWGHAVLIVGYDDEREFKNFDGRKTKGGIKFFNSWGKDWGENGFGWLTYDYIKYFGTCSIKDKKEYEDYNNSFTLFDLWVLTDSKTIDIKNYN